jgi:hypothetical protein
MLPLWLPRLLRLSMMQKIRRAASSATAKTEPMTIPAMAAPDRDVVPELPLLLPEGGVIVGVGEGVSNDMVGVIVGKTIPAQRLLTLEL